MARIWPGCGALSQRRRAALSLRNPRGVSPADAPPANGEPHAGMPDPGSTAVSIAGGGTCVHTPCASTTAFWGGVLWRERERVAYRGGCPRERTSPKGSPGRVLLHSPRALIKTGTRRASLRAPRRREQDHLGNNTGKETVFGKFASKETQGRRLTEGTGTGRRTGGSRRGERDLGEGDSARAIVEGCSGKKTLNNHDPATLRVALSRRSKMALFSRSVPPASSAMGFTR